MKHILITLLAVVALVNAFAQSKSDDYYRHYPAWIEMMEENHVQYDLAVKAFHLFWENREKPTTENEMFAATSEEKAQTNFVRSKKMKKESTAIQYAFEYKKFIRWQAKVLSYLNSNGTVMNADERMVSWKKQIENRK